MRPLVLFKNTCISIYFIFIGFRKMPRWIYNEDDKKFTFFLLDDQKMLKFSF